MALCVCIGSVSLSLRETVTVIWNAIFGIPDAGWHLGADHSLCAVAARALRGAHGRALLALRRRDAGALKNPLADGGSTLGVASGASLSAVIAIAFGITLPQLPLPWYDGARDRVRVSIAVDHSLSCV
ncbi:MAG: hypothetical protein R2912_11340 [Eubacteriales bacterium]